jgi:hypothetical protein
MAGRGARTARRHGSGGARLTNAHGGGRRLARLLRTPYGRPATMTDLAVPTDAPPAAAAPVWSRPAFVVLLGITALAAVLRLWGIRDWSWNGDEAATWRALQLPLAGGSGFFSASESRAPLAHFALRWLVDSGLLPSLGEGALRLPFAFVGIVTVPLLALSGRRFVGTWPALLAALLLACHPAHVAHSQTAAAAVVLPLVWTLLPRTLAAHRSFALFAAILVAGLADPTGWCAVPLVVATVLPNSWSRAYRLAFGLAAAVFAALALPEWGLPLAAAAVLGGLLVPPSPRQLLVVLLPVLTVSVAPRVAALAALPGVTLLAASGSAALAARWRSSLPPSRWAPLVAWLPATVVVVALFVDAFLWTTLFAGGRPPWRDAARLVLRTGEGAQALVVGAAGGRDVLVCYLRPRHWQQPDVDAHPLVQVAALHVEDPASSLQQLLATASERRAAAFLVLGGVERRRFLADAAAAALLERRFRVSAVLPAPGVAGDDSLFVMAARTND